MHGDVDPSGGMGGHHVALGLRSWRACHTQTDEIANCSSFAPFFKASLSQRGRGPRPDQTLPAASLNFGARVLFDGGLARDEARFLAGANPRSSAVKS